MARRLKKSKKIALISAAVVAGTSVAAFAYWTAGGSGTGSATTGTVVPLTAVQTSTVSAMAPGLAAQTLTGNFTNPNDGPVYVATVTASISSVTQSGLPAVGCDAGDYTLANAIMTVGAEVPAGAAKGAWTGATLAFNNKAGTNQDACKGATVNLAYSIS